jgi:two-component system sensor histidine kinase FlrB
MQHKEETRSVELEHAFKTFNTLSEQLAESYHALEKRVSTLSKELAQAKTDRVAEYAEKERIANRLTQLLDVLPGGVVVIDAKGIITESNPAALTLLGEPLVGEQWREIIDRAFEPEMDEGSEVNLKNGKRVTITTRSLVNEAGKIILIMDVTEQHALQAMLNRHYKLTAMGEMAASLAHQIRTPLATAILYMSHLSRPTLDDEGRTRTLEKVAGRLRNLDHMVNDMLQFAKSGHFDMECVSLKEVIDSVAQTIEPQVKLNEGRIEFHGINDTTYIRGNRDALQGAILNLCTNAIQAKGSGIHIVVSVSQTQDNKVQITVEDNGGGIEKESLPNLFTPFFTTRPDGTGLGLAVVEMIVEAHNGTIDVKSEEGMGASFRILIPHAKQKDIIASAVKNQSSPEQKKRAG